MWIISPLLLFSSWRTPGIISSGESVASGGSLSCAVVFLGGCTAVTVAENMFSVSCSTDPLAGSCSGVKLPLRINSHRFRPHRKVSPETLASYSYVDTIILGRISNFAIFRAFLCPCSERGHHQPLFTANDGKKMIRVCMYRRPSQTRLRGSEQNPLVVLSLSLPESGISVYFSLL